jgi:4-amino-4-deoxy-L-arabinose transferase-like glycosyltransferase
MMTSDKRPAVPMRANQLIILLALAHLVLALLYSNETPYRQAGFVLSGRQPVAVPDYGAPDERQHANYVQSLMDGKGFPVFKPGAPDAGEHYEDHQPPLFYILDAAWCRLIGSSDLTLPTGNRCRMLNAFLGAATVVGVFCLALWGLGRTDVGLAAAAFAAFLPMMASLNGALSNDPLLFCLCTWTLAILARQMRSGWNWRPTLAVGLLTGLAMLTKTTAVALLPAIALAAIFPIQTKPKLSLPALAFLVAFVVVLPWWIRNQALYGDPLALDAFNKAFVGSPRSQAYIDALGAQAFWVKMFGLWSMRSFFGVFGYMDIFLNSTSTPYMGPKDPNTLYLCLFFPTLILTIIGILTAFRSNNKSERPVHILNLAFFIIVSLLYIRFNLIYFQAQSRYLFPAIGPIAVAIGYGLCELVRKPLWIASAGIAIILGAVNVYALGRLPGDFALRAAQGPLSKAMTTDLPSQGGSAP